jgi:hypothetical protein
MQIVIWGGASVLLLVAATLIAAAIDRRAGWDRLSVAVHDAERERAAERPL